MSETTEARFAEWLKAARTEAGMSQQKVADALRAQGFTVFRQSAIAKIEGGNRPVLLTEAVAMAELFGTTLDVALGLKPTPQRFEAQALARRTSVLQQIQRLAETELDGGA
jgi:transcriptional regulator with XRE-family HTH domain